MSISLPKKETRVIDEEDGKSKVIDRDSFRKTLGAKGFLNALRFVGSALVGVPLALAATAAALTVFAICRVASNLWEFSQGSRIGILDSVAEKSWNFIPQVWFGFALHAFLGTTRYTYRVLKEAASLSENGGKENEEQLDTSNSEVKDLHENWQNQIENSDGVFDPVAKQLQESREINSGR